MDENDYKGNISPDEAYIGKILTPEEQKLFEYSKEPFIFSDHFDIVEPEFSKDSIISYHGIKNKPLQGMKK